MNYEGFVIEVERRMPGRSWEEAERALTAVLAVLSERLDRENRRALAAHLPDRLKELFPDKAVQADHGPDEFLARVDRRANIRDYAPRDLVLVVMKVLGLALPTGELPRILERLPPELRQLWAVRTPSRPGRPDKPPVRG